MSQSSSFEHQISQRGHGNVSKGSITERRKVTQIVRQDCQATAFDRGRDGDVGKAGRVTSRVRVVRQFSR